MKYLPGESDSGLFGGNSNWRGPIWFPLNYLLIEALGRYHRFYGDGLKVECPTGSGPMDDARRGRAGACHAAGAALPAGRQRPPAVSGKCSRIGQAIEPLLFYEYFDAETGRGLGASHQTGWTALVANCLEKLCCLTGADGRG